MPDPLAGPRWSVTVTVTDLHACPRCQGIIDGAASLCPGCGHWLGPASVGLWSAMVVAGGGLTLAAFFLPWLTSGSVMGGQALSGYDLARMAQQLASSSGARPTAAVSLALYLVPAAGVALLVVPGVAALLRLRWAVVGRVLVGLAAVPCQLAVLAALFALGFVGDSAFAGWPNVGLFGAGVGSLLGLVGGVILGGQRVAGSRG